MGGGGDSSGGGRVNHTGQRTQQKNGEVYLVSYHPRDDYTITYGKRDKDNPENAVIITEIKNIYADQLCETFTDTTGFKIPVVAFG